MGAIADISFREGKGSDFYLELIVDDADSVEDHIIHFKMVDGITPEDTTLITKTTGDPGNVVEHFDNRIVINFASNETDYNSGIDSGQYYIEATLEDPFGNKKLVGQGLMTLLDTHIKLGAI